MPLNCRKMHAQSQLANPYSQPDLSTRIFHCQVSQIWRFTNSFSSENYRLALIGKKNLATLFVTSSTFRKQDG